MKGDRYGISYERLIGCAQWGWKEAKRRGCPRLKAQARRLYEQAEALRAAAC